MKSRIVRYFTENRSPKWFAFSIITAYLAAMIGHAGGYEGYVVATACTSCLFGLIGMCIAASEF